MPISPPLRKSSTRPHQRVQVAGSDKAPAKREDAIPARAPTSERQRHIALREELARELEDDAEPGRATTSGLDLQHNEALETERHAPTATRLPMWKPSDQIYVMGFDLPGRYIAHALAGCETIPPVRYLMHAHYMYKTWKENGQRFTLHKGKESIVHDRVIGEYIPPVDDTYQEPHNDKVIENLIVTVPAGHVVRALEPIRHRLDHRSSICLIQDGLGVAEAVVDAYFPNPTTRPAFILGHLASALGFPAQQDRFGVTEVHQRRLYLTLFSPNTRGPELERVIKKHPPTERVLRQTHLLRLLTAMPGLNAHGHPMVDFLRYKLFTVAFRAVADPIATLLDSPYNKVAENTYARQLMDACIGELCDVVTRLPECRNQQKFRRFYLGTTLREQIYKALMRKRTADSVMRANTVRGWDTDVDYLTGFFVKRGRELRVPVSGLEALMLAVKAKQMVAKTRINSVIPFEEYYGRDKDTTKEGEELVEHEEAPDEEEWVPAM